MRMFVNHINWQLKQNAYIQIYLMEWLRSPHKITSHIVMSYISNVIPFEGAFKNSSQIQVCNHQKPVLVSGQSNSNLSYKHSQANFEKYCS